MGAPTASAQNPYWNNHWRWYDNTYRPYYQRYYNGPSYYGRSYYGPSYYGTSPGYYYSPPSGYYNNYYYGPGYVQPYAGVRVGPMSFGWW
jgi:hypothetical protein